MKRFIKNLFLFFLPVLLFFTAMIPFYRAAVNSGEFRDLQENIKAQRNNQSILLGLGYNEQTPYYKLSNANYYKAEVIALGTSRVMQFKKEFFKSNFYNCGGAVGGNYNEYINFLKNLTYKPKVILLGLDQWVFNDAWNQSCKEYTGFIKIEQEKRNKAVMLKKIVKDWKHKKWKLSDLDMYPNNIGFNGRIKDAGFMADGSYYYGDVYRNPQGQKDYLFKDTYVRIMKGNGRFEWGMHIDTDTMKQLRSLLAYCSDNQIRVVGILPPFAPSVYGKMKATGNYGYLDEIEPACRKLFDGYGCELFDYTDITNLKGTDAYFVDGFHGSDVLYGIILQDMSVQSALLAQHIDRNKLTELLSKPYSLCTFFNPDKRNEMAHYVFCKPTGAGRTAL